MQDRHLPYSSTDIATPFHICPSAVSVSIDLRGRQAIRIDLLPDDVLLEIFHFYVNMSSWYYGKGFQTSIEAWQSLVHVCRRWRSLVFGSPRRLDLKLFCTPQTPAKDTLDVWPALPLIVEGDLASSNNIVAALEQSDRIRQVDLRLTSRDLGKVLAPMQVPFPALTDLHLWSCFETPAIPDPFLGGSAPRLRRLSLNSISFRGLPKLLLSATHLTQLYLYSIPHSGYISPQAMVSSLSVLFSLETLLFHFESPQSRPDRESQSLPPPGRSVLPALIEFHFKGVAEYLEELVTRIDTPQLNVIDIRFFNQIDFDCPRLTQFIDCTPTLKAHDEAHVQFNDGTARVTLKSQTQKIRDYDILIGISCREPDWQLSSIEQVCNSSLCLLTTVEHLYIENRYLLLVWKDEAIENNLWLELLFPFTAVKNLYLSKEFAPGIADALQALARGRMTEVLPSLQNIFVGGVEILESFQENIAQFIAARRLSGHPIAISDWDGKVLTRTQS